MLYETVNEAKLVFSRGGNVTEHLKSRANGLSEKEIIEISYDIQSGSYIALMEEKLDSLTPLFTEMSERLSPSVGPSTTLLDIGTGEMTTIAQVMQNPAVRYSRLLAFDVSLSRLSCGRGYWRRRIGEARPDPTIFCAEMSAIPLPSKSVDVVTSSHALEPNRDALPAILKELFRVCRSKLVLFEPSFEHASEEGRARMDRHGYIRNLPGEVEKLGGTVISVTPLENIHNPLNPTTCHEIVPPSPLPEMGGGEIRFTAPGSDLVLEQEDGCLRSADAGYAFPVMNGIPILRPSAGVLFTNKGC